MMNVPSNSRFASTGQDGKVLLALAAAAVMVMASSPAAAAEIRLRPQCQPRASLVTLGDVADIKAVDGKEAEKLAAVELFPAPASSRKRYLHVRELRELLAARGIDVFEHRLSGASEVLVLGGRRVSTVETAPTLSTAALRRANDRVAEAVKRFLDTQTGRSEAWTVETNLSQDQARPLSQPKADVSISHRLTPGTPHARGVYGWVGVRQFEVTAVVADGREQFLTDVRISLPPAVVVAARPLSRGTLIRSSDVTLRHESVNQRISGQFGSLEEVVGMETTQAITQGGVLLRDRSVRQPLLVRRGDPVTVMARSAGVCVTTTGRARQDGCLGELIEIESLQSRKRYFARVTRWREAEIYVHAPEVKPVRRVQASPNPSVYNQPFVTKGSSRANPIR